ncbi:MAG: hypothetical protein HKN63_04815 [Rhodobacteraceae bacterium]|nr:hypothetical protein [Paracoccaceae bacterium]
MCYGGVSVAGLLGFLRGGRLAVILSGLYVALYAGGQIAETQMSLNPRIPLFLSLSLPFFIGMVFYRWRAQLPLNWLAGIALALGAAALRGSVVFEPVFVLFLCYWVFLVGYRIGGPVRRYNELGDYSYGVYIYAFPMQQAASHFLGPQGPLTNMAVAAPLTLLFAVLSWHLIERRALASKRSVATWFEQRLRVSRAGL